MSYSFCRVQWEQAAPLLKNVREKVFVCEWRIPRRIEFDRKDRLAYHMLVCDDGTQEPIATGRIMPTGEISRIAVLMHFRDQDVDQLILQGLLKVARELNLTEVYIHSPLEAIEYFRQHHFNTVGSVFMEAGIPRQRMACRIENVHNANYFLTH